MRWFRYLRICQTCYYLAGLVPESSPASRHAGPSGIKLCAHVELYWFPGSLSLVSPPRIPLSLISFARRAFDRVPHLFDPVACLCSPPLTLAFADWLNTSPTSTWTLFTPRYSSSRSTCASWGKVEVVSRPPRTPPLLSLGGHLVPLTQQTPCVSQQALHRVVQEKEPGGSPWAHWLHHRCLRRTAQGSARKQRRYFHVGSDLAVDPTTCNCTGRCESPKCSAALLRLRLVAPQIVFFQNFIVVIAHSTRCRK